MPSRNAENELGNESGEIEEAGDTHPKINGDFRPALQGKDAVVEKEQSHFGEEHGEGIEWR